MKSILELSAADLTRAAKLKTKIEKLQKKLASLSSDQNRTDTTKPKRKMSAKGRAAIIAAQKARWAKIKNKN